VANLVVVPFLGGHMQPHSLILSGGHVEAFALDSLTET
jgi:hypothetical protein